MTNKVESESDEPKIAALMRTLDANTLAPDAAVLEALRIQAAAKFEETERRTGLQTRPDTDNEPLLGSTPSSSIEAQTDGARTPKTGLETRPTKMVLSTTTTQHTRSKPMITLLASRSLATIVAIVSAIALWFNLSPTSSALSATPFSKVLSELRGANSLQLKISKDGVAANVLVRAPGLLRWEESAQKYQIAAGSRLWKIDETQNTATESDSPWFLGPQEQIDLLGLLNAGVSDASRLLDARPVEQATRDGRECLIYRVALPAGKGEDRIDVEAAADAKSLQLVEILAWKSGSKRTGPPLAEMQLVAVNIAVADEKFAVSKSLTEDGRIGKISDAQGIVVLRPMLAKRWTPICRETLLRPGDWIRTELRGANAVKVTLSSDVDVTLGPGTLLECISPVEARLHSGMVKVASPDLDVAEEAWRFSLLGPRDEKRSIEIGTSLMVRTDRNEKLVDVAQTPPWLAGFEGTSNNESLGSLIVTLPDGRNEPLTVGYHKVSVEIRDQIARTTIEESFVNHTAGRLEGVFHFPLPQDASISGFGMWIGNDLIEADVVEKQRAREIYETILREKRDPGLLEWTGGNIFKARVFPIEARSEKRIKIVYTQVLPLRANRYRYSYGLRSELLRTSPLRELSLSVTVNSALALKSVTCPTHSARISVGRPSQAVSVRDQDGLRSPSYNSAQVEFTAQEYSPTRDFEVVCEIDGKQNDVVVVPHQRGEDGYFLMQLTPPGTDGNWQREVLPDGEPLNLVLMCDTSMSMDAEKRREQAEFVAAVLASLGPDDHFQIVAADVDTSWASAEPMAPNAENIETATKLLNDRVSLGWTDLDRAFDDVLSKAPVNANIVYIGDGILSAGDTDPAAFVKRLAVIRSRIRQNSDATALTNPNSDESGYGSAIHAVTVGNSNDSVVMQGIATIGGGSVRSISGEQTPQIAAMELLNEIAQPGLRDLNVEFTGLKVAAVYPEKLPNVAAGTQQILVGRYLPEGADQQGEIIVAGKRGTEDVRYAAKVNFKDAEEGNSFIPRLWARSHLDQLLAQGGSQAVQDDIIRLSEEFHIITPYTSLLVLETDADRERFGVQRRYEMRDGERFFAQGKANANFDLLQQQMKRAGDWRIGLRRSILSNLIGLGRDLDALQEQQQTEQFRRMSGMRGAFPMSGPIGGMGDGSWSGFDGAESNGGVGGGMGGFGFEDEDQDHLSEFDSAPDSPDGEFLSLGVSVDRSELVAEESSSPGPTYNFDVDEPMSLSLAKKKDSSFGRYRNGGPQQLSNSEFALGGLFGLDKAISPYGQNAMEPMEVGGLYFKSGYLTQQPDYTSWMNALFPTLPPVLSEPITKADDRVRWSDEAIALANSLLRTESLLAMDGGIELLRDVEYVDPRWNRSSGRSIDHVLYSPTAWLTRGNNVTEQAIINYCDAQERAVYAPVFGLGRTRPSVAVELTLPPLGLADASLASLHKTHADWSAAIEPAGDDQVRLVLTLKETTNKVHYTIDTVRHVVLKQETFDDGKLTFILTFDDFVEIAGTWWARHMVQTNEQGQTIADTRIEISALTPDDYTQRMQQQLTDKVSVQFLREPLVPVKAARQHVADGRANFDDRFAMILFNAQFQRWDEMWKHVEAAEELAADKPGVRWIRTMLFAVMRRNEEARLRLIDEAQRLLTRPSQDEVFLAEFITAQSSGLSASPEFFSLHRLLKPVYERPLSDRIPGTSPRRPDDPAAEQLLRDGMSQRIMALWDDREANLLEQLGRREEALVVWRANAESRPWDVYAQQNYTQRLVIGGDFDAAHVWLRQELARPERSPYDDEILRAAVCDLYRKQARWADLQKWTADWIERSPESVQYDSAYSQHLAAMIYNDQLPQAYEQADQWLIEGRVEGKMTTVQRQRFDAALSLANGRTHDLHFQRMDERWLEPLATAARFFVRHPHHFDIVSRCTSNYYFNESDTADRLRGEWLTMLRNEAATLSPTQLQSLVDWALQGRMELAEPLNDRKQLNASEVPTEVWAKIAESLKSRWLQMEDGDDRRLLSESLVTIYANRFRETLLLPFLRERVEAAAGDVKSIYTSVLFENLLTAPWTAETEEEAFAVLRRLSTDDDAWEQLSTELPALYRLIDAILANRIAAAETQLNDQGGLDKVTRKELAAKKAEITATARTELAARVAELTGTTEEPLAAWLRLEQMWLEIPLMQNLTEAEAACRQMLGDAPPNAVLEADEADDNDVAAETVSHERHKQFFERQLKRRAFITALRLAVRAKAPADSAEWLLRYIDAGIAQGGDAAEVWRQAKFQFLIALDRADDLEREMREWIRVDVSTAGWRQMLSKLLAERGKIDEAISLFEACEKDKLLTAADYRMLADWYLVSNRRTDYERARIESFKKTPEYTLQQMLSQTRNHWSRSDIPLPSELDEATLFVLKALFATSASPENYFYQVRELYGACRDFRLLQMLPDAMLGRSPQQVYAFLERINSYVLVELRNEATADELIARIRELRGDLKGGGDLNGAAPSKSPDLRALDLLEALVERKSSEILNQPGPHVNACLAAMQRAFRREWADGEPAMMARFLYQLGALTNETLKAEQLRELDELRKLAPARSRERLSITTDFCHLKFSHYGLQNEAMMQMEIDVRDYVQANDGTWPSADHELLSRYVAMLEQANQHAAGEQLLQKFMAAPENDAQIAWMKDRLLSLYNHALEHDGSVSIGSGRANIFGPLTALALRELADAPDENIRYSLVTRLSATFDTAHRHQVPGTRDVVHRFAFETIPALLKQQHQQYAGTATRPVSVIQNVLTPQEALRYVVERIEQYPQRFEVQYNTSWNSFGGSLTTLRTSAGPGDLDDRILKIALAQLKKYLRTGELNSPGMFYQGYSEFWKEKQPDFAAAAEKVLNERRSSGRRAMAVAQYFRNGLADYPRAIEILNIAHGKGLLNETEQHTLANWLREQNRYAEMIPVLEPLVKHHPDTMVYRTNLMVAYFHSQRAEQLQTLIEETDAFFHDRGRWTEANAVQFGNGCLAVNEWNRAKQYFTEAIALHQRAHPGSGLNNETLSQHYQYLAGAESALGNTKDAVTAAMSSIVCWDARHENREYAISALQAAVNSAKDLDGFVAQLDAEAAASGQDNPILRKAIGNSYVNRNEPAIAIVQFRLALELQPNDRETHQALISGYDAVGDKAAASAQLRQLIDLQPHDLELYKQLAERLKDSPLEAERAATSIIESSPNEAESHAAMAELRQSQDRWSEAIPHWEQVARYRKLEPTGLLKLAEAQIHERRFVEAAQSVRTLRHTDWPSRFGDLESQLRMLEQKLQK